MEKRVVFKSSWLPWLLLTPQLVIIGVFFFWPAAQAFIQSVQTEDPFGLSTEFVGMANFQRLWNDPGYLDSFRTTAIYSTLVPRWASASRWCWRCLPTASCAAPPSTAR